jgi:Divergent InlB B-repeat domain/Galactose oxidase, central domain
MKTKSNSRSAFLIPRVVLGTALCSAGVFLALAGLNKSGAETPGAKIVASQPGTWTATGSMSIARAYFTATLLTNGKVLVAGGCIVNPCFNGTSSAELYDPGTGTWTSTGSMTTPRASHTATLLADGKVLVAGGQVQTCLTTSSAELYDPDTGTWTSTGSMNIGRGGHMATLITSGPLAGMVLASGGYINQNDGGCGGVAQLASAELYDPATGFWSATSGMTKARDFPSAQTLPDASVLVIGHLNCCPYTWLNNAESYNSGTQVWTPTPRKATFANDAVVLLPNGKVLVAGGRKGIQPTAINVADAELFDSSTGTWTATASMSTDRYLHTLTLLNSGQVLVAGGFSGGWGVCNDLTSSELYDLSAGTWFPTGNMTAARWNFRAALLPNGKVLAAGGTDCEGNILSSAELYTPTSTPRPITVTFNTNPAGLAYRVDGTTYHSAHVFSWPAGSTHTIATNSPQSGGSGTRYVWQRWSDNGAMSHTIAPTTSTAYTATFTTQHYLTMNAGAGGTVMPASGWRNKGAQVTIRATPSNGYHFTRWTGSGNGSYSGTNNPASITMTGPITETAFFRQ